MAGTIESNSADFSFRAKILPSQFAGLLCAVVVYAFAALSIFWPHVASLNHIDFIMPFSIVFAATGTFLFARGFGSAYAAFVAGLLYAFSPYILSFVAYHPFVVLLAATIPWLMWQGFSSRFDFALGRQLLAVVAILMLVFGFFRLATTASFFPMPLHTGPAPSTLVELAAFPQAATASFSFNLYHLGSMLVFYAIFRHLLNLPPVLVLLAAMGIILALSNPFSAIPPAIWGTLPICVLCLLAGKAFDSLICRKPSRLPQMRLLTLAILIPIAVTLYLHAPASISPLWFTVSIATAAVVITRQFTNKPASEIVVPIIVTAISINTICYAMLLIDSILQN